MKQTFKSKRLDKKFNPPLKIEPTKIEIDKELSTVILLIEKSFDMIKSVDFKLAEISCCNEINLELKEFDSIEKFGLGIRACDALTKISLSLRNWKRLKVFKISIVSCPNFEKKNPLTI